MSSMLSLTASFPTREYASNDVVITEGEQSNSLWVLLSGELEVRKGNVVVNFISRPGAVIGEISMLLDTCYSATVIATKPSVLRFIEDGNAFLSSPEVCRLIAIALAERLSFATSYLADLKNQYGDAPGLAMVSDVLNELSQRQAPLAKPGSARDPDPEY